MTSARSPRSTASGSLRRRIATALITATLLAGSGAFGVSSVAATVSSGTATQIADAIKSSSANVTSATFVTTAGTSPNGIGDAALGGFPTGGPTFGILTTGAVGSVDDPGTFANTQNGGLAVRGDTDRDVTVLKVDLTVPAGANCLTFDFKFLSEEFDGFVGAGYNDAFIAELGSSTWTTDGSAIDAPNNFAFDADDNVVSINSTGLLQMSAPEGAGTAFDGVIAGTELGGGGATGLLQASTQVTPGVRSVFFSIFDQLDQAYDSAVFLDNLVVGFVPDPVDNCKRGATLLTEVLGLTPASATSPTGTAHMVTAKLTDPDGSPIAGRSIDFTVAGVNPGTGSGTTNASGEATFTYTGTNVGQDQINACTVGTEGCDGSATASATKDWVAPSADLSLTKTDSPDPVTSGGDVTYTLTVHNSGPDAAAGATLTDTLPAGVTFKSASAGCNQVAGIVTCSIAGPIANGADEVRSIVVTTSGSGSISNTASIASATADPNAGNNGANEGTTVNPVTKTCPANQTCEATATSQSGQTTATVTAGPGATITASFSTLAQANYTACGTTTPRDATGVLTFNATGSKLPKLIKFVVANVKPFLVCWNAPVKFKQRGGTWSSPDPILGSGFTGLLPECLAKNPTLPCVLPVIVKASAAKANVYVVAPAGDPKGFIAR